jgi:ribosomal protein S24E
MEFKITEEKENALFNRKEIKGFIDSEVVPSRIETSKILSEKFKVPWENIKIKKIVGKFGSKTFSVEANIYSSKQDKDSIELKKKKEIESEKKATEETAAKEAPEEATPAPEEKPQEDVKEEEPKKDTQLKSENQSEPQGEVKEQ